MNEKQKMPSQPKKCRSTRVGARPQQTRPQPNEGIVSMHDLVAEETKWHGGRYSNDAESCMPTGFTDIDCLTGGFYPSELTILAARPGVGKTALALNIAVHASLEINIPTLFISLDLSRWELARRMVCSQARVGNRQYQSGIIVGDDKAKLAEAFAKLGTAPMFIDETSARTFSEIASSARQVKRDNGLGFLVIDDLQFILFDDAHGRRQKQLAKLVHDLKLLACELKVPVFCLSRLNRPSVARLGRTRPGLRDLRESGVSERHADTVLFLHRPIISRRTKTAREKGVDYQTDVIAAKQNHGPLEDVKLAWNPDFVCFDAIERSLFFEDDGEQSRKRGKHGHLPKNNFGFFVESPSTPAPIPQAGEECITWTTAEDW